MEVKIKLTKRQVAEALRDLGNERTGPFITKGCKCLRCGILRAVRTSIKRQSESR
jgi:hypothetical protein